MGQAASSSEVDSQTWSQENANGILLSRGSVGTSAVLHRVPQECHQKQSAARLVYYCTTAAAGSSSSCAAMEEAGCVSGCKQPSPQQPRLQIVELIDVTCHDQLRKIALHHEYNWTQCDPTVGAISGSLRARLGSSAGGRTLINAPSELADLTLGLPDECVASVFAKLSTAERNACSLVCKRWHAIDAKSRWQLSLEGKRELYKDLSSVLLRFEHLTSLTLNCHRRSSGSSIEDSGLALVARMLTQLEQLKLKGCRALTDAGLEQFSTMCSRSFRKLSLSCCSFGAKGVNAMLVNCADQLEEVSVKRLKRLLENPSPIHGAAPGKSKLHRISLKDTLNAQIFGSVIAGATRLRTLILARNPGYWDHLLQVATENLTHLQELRCESLQMSDTSLIAISRCRNLEVVYLIKTSECTNHGLSALVSGCAKLKKLYLDDRKSSRLGDGGLVSVAKRCTQLREVVLVGVNASEDSLAKMASACTSLERLALCSSDSIRDAELHMLAHKCMSLKKLCIKECPGISDYGLQIFATGCPRLIKLKIKKCANVTPFAAFWLQRNRPSLKVSLDISVHSNTQHPPAILRDVELDQQQEDRHRNDRYVNIDRFIRSSTEMPCSSRSIVLKSKLTLAAGNLLRKLPRSSANCSPLVG